MTIEKSSQPKLSAFYLSRDRLLAMLNVQSMPARVLDALSGKDIPMASAILSNSVGTHLFESIGKNQIRTLQQLAIEGTLKKGSQFIYHGHLYGNGFGARNKTSAVSLSERLDEPLKDIKLLIEFSKNGLVNDTAYTRLSGSTRLFVFGYVADMDDQTIRAVPYAIGDLVDGSSALSFSFEVGQEIFPQNIDQFAKMDEGWTPAPAEFKRMKTVSEQTVKELVGKLLSEVDVDKDWGGEEADLFSSNVLVDGRRRTAAFLLKGPARFHKMTLADCGKNGDQIYRLFNIPADIYVVQHCHMIGPAVRKTVAAFALDRALQGKSCQYVFVDGFWTARLLKANKQWPKK